VTDDSNPPPAESGIGHPQQVGPYRILDVLGEGGMAVVYLAQQSEPVNRRVALKILKPGMDTRQIIARFESERQALAVLDHPNIAKVFDGGITDSGRPFFAMEHVRGEPINDYCDKHRLPTDQRIAIFVDVCSAVQHAHHKGLIHRDLKPSNILVGITDGKPHVKVIDFGIAKATGGTLTDKTLFTRIGQVVGTPQYMSPEQADLSGLDVDTRTDIYSLGVVLYELLVGALPLELAHIAEHAVRLALKEEDPPKPSTRITQLGDTRDDIAWARQTDPPGLRRQIAGDLDWIVMKSIAKDRTRRYETANALAMECRRYLQHQPVLARAPSAGYILQRFVRRNRISVAAGAIAAIAIMAGAAAATIGMLHAQRAEREAVREAETARLVSDFLEELFEVSDPYDSDQASTDITAHDLIVNGSERLNDELTDRPDIQARLMSTMGGVFVSLGDYDRSQELLDRAITIQTGITPANDLALAKSRFNLGRMYYEQGEYDRSAKELETALTIYSEAGDADSEAIAEVLEFNASVAVQQSRFADARDILARAADIRRRLPDTPPAVLGESVNSLGLALFSMGDYQAANRAFQEAILHFQNGPKTGLYARAMANLAASHQLIGNSDRAIEVHQDALALKRDVFGPRHIEVAYSLNNLGNLYREMGQFPEAEANLMEALDIFQESLGPQHGNVGVVMIGIGNLLRDAERFDEARSYYADSLPILRQVFGDDSVRVIQSLNGQGYSELMQGNFRNAQALFQQSIAKAEALGEPHPELGSAYAGLASVDDSNHSREERDRLFQDGIRILDETAGIENYRTVDARFRYAGFLRDIGQIESAKVTFGSALDALGNAAGIEHPLYLKHAAEFDALF